MEDKADMLQMQREGAHCTGVPFKPRETRPNARDKEDTDNGENIFVQKKEGGVVDRNWVLLDSQSTVDQISNHAMLTNI